MKSTRVYLLINRPEGVRFLCFGHLDEIPRSRSAMVTARLEIFGS